MRRAVVLARIICNRHIAFRKRHVLARHHESGGLHLPGHAVRVGRVREHVRAVARHGPHALALTRQPFHQRRAILCDGDCRTIAAIPLARIRERFITCTLTDAIMLDRQPERLRRRRHSYGIRCAAERHSQTGKRKRRRPCKSVVHLHFLSIKVFIPLPPFRSPPGRRSGSCGS